MNPQAAQIHILKHYITNAEKFIQAAKGVLMALETPEPPEHIRTPLETRAGSTGLSGALSANIQGPPPTPKGADPGAKMADLTSALSKESILEYLEKNNLKHIQIKWPNGRPSREFLEMTFTNIVAQQQNLQQQQKGGHGFPQPPSQV